MLFFKGAFLWKQPFKKRQQPLLFPIDIIQSWIIVDTNHSETLIENGIFDSPVIDPDCERRTDFRISWHKPPGDELPVTHQVLVHVSCDSEPNSDQYFLPGKNAFTMVHILSFNSRNSMILLKSGCIRYF